MRYLCTLVPKLWLPLEFGIITVQQSFDPLILDTNEEGKQN